MAVNKMKSEVMFLNIKAQDQKQQFEAIDRQAHQMIGDRFPDDQNLRANYKSYWAEQSRLEEEKSQEVLKKKQEWPDNLEFEEDTESTTNVESRRSCYKDGRVSNSRFNGPQNNFRKPTYPARYNQVRGTFRNSNRANINTRRNMPSTTTSRTFNQIE